MWLANARLSRRNAPNVRPRARPIIDLLPDTRIIEIPPRQSLPLRRHLLQSRHPRLVPPPRPVQRRPLVRRPRLARPLIRRRRPARPRPLVPLPNQQVSPKRFNRGIRNGTSNPSSVPGNGGVLGAAGVVSFRNPQSAIRDPHFSIMQRLEEVRETFPANLDSDTE
jgi:hypothetical protein